MPALVSHDDKVVGVLQALNKRAEGGFTSYDEKVAQALCGHAAVAIDTAQLIARDLERQRMARDLELAQDIQRRLLPDEVPDLAGWRLAGWQRTWTRPVVIITIFSVASRAGCGGR